MSLELCLFCKGSEKKYKPMGDNEFICSRCVQMLIAADQQDLKGAHGEAIDKGFINKAKAIESFMVPEEINVRETKKSKRNMGRKRPMRTVGPPRH